ncbi:MAG: hypothetical protein ABJ251_05055 [Paracoccaceae bacterium]
MSSNKETKIDSPGTALLASIESNEVVGIASDVVEVGLDSLLDEGVLRDLPIFGWLAGLSKTFGSVRDALFARKVVHFLNQLPSLTEEQRLQTLAKLKANDKPERIGQTIISFLERSENENKPGIFGRLWCALARNEISETEFWTLCNVVDRCPPNCLREFSEFLTAEDERHTNQSFGYICVTAGFGDFQPRVNGLSFHCDDRLAKKLSSIIRQELSDS